MAAPQLRLDVSLNLSGFRGEIQKLTNIAQSEFVPKINIKFNRRTLDVELNNLQAAIKRRVYRVEIGGNIDKLPDKIRGLKEQLSSLESFKIDLGIGAVKSLSKKDAKDIASGLRAQILGEQSKLYVPVSIKPSISRENVRDFKNAVKSKLTGLSVDVKANVQGGGFAGTKSGAAGLMEYMQKEGLLGKTASGMTMRMEKDSGEIKQQLNEAVQSAEKIKSVFDGVAKNIATTGKSIANIQGKRIGLANVPLMAGAVEKRVGRSAAAIGGTVSSDALKALYPEISKTIVSFADLRGQIQQNTSKLSGFSLIIGLAAFAGVPLAKSIVKLTESTNGFAKLLDKLGPQLEAAFTKAASNILSVASSRLLNEGSVFGLLPPAYRGIGPAAAPAGPAGLLPPAYRGIMPAREPRGLLGAGSAPAGLLTSVTLRGAAGEMMRQLTEGNAPPSPPAAGGRDNAGKLFPMGAMLQALQERLTEMFGIREVSVSEDIRADFKRALYGFSLLAQTFTESMDAVKQSRVEEKVKQLIAALEREIDARNVRIAGFLPPAGSVFANREAAARTRGDVEFGPRATGELRPITEDPRVASFRQLLEQRDERDNAVFAELAKLRDAASRRLPAGAVAQVGTTAQDQAVRDFYNALREGTLRIQKATRQLLTGTQLSGLLPSREMVDQRKFAAAIQKAVVVDMQNALQFEAQKKMLPAAGETAFAANMRQSLQGSVFRAPATGGRGDATREELKERERSVRAAQARRRSEERSAQILEADDRRRASIRALLDAETAQELRDAASRRQLLREGAERLLPAGIPAIADQGAQSAVVGQFYTSMRAAQQMLERNFSANSYLPQATMILAASMMQASASIKALPAARSAMGALPSAEMMEPLRFQRAMAKAVQVDMENALQQQMQGRMLPAAGQTSYRSPEQIARQAEQQASAEAAAKAAREQAGEMIRAVRAELRTPLLPPGITYPSSPVGSMGQFPMSGMAGRGSMGQFPMDGPLAVGGASAMGQKIAGPYPWSNTTRSARGGYIPGIRSSLFFPMEGMIGPSSPLGSEQSSYQPLQAGRITPQSSMFAGSGGGGGGVPPSGGGGGGAFGGGGFNVPNLPGAGLVREIGTEFGFAAKQVLLFGTAYKALAFLQGFPGQVGDAVGALQSFRNTLNAISPTAQEAAASSAFILNIVDKYNVPLQSARDGFTKLYASMAPTGFSGNEIRDLFTGISQAAATFGMSSDKVDRVTYAFAQMASKGQVMSEELKGQLGDVLPGAMGIFAKAAGFEGADAIQKFGKALEDGAFKGKPMRDLLKNVTVELKREFGPGAEGAARTYQGVMTRMANSTKLLYESFEPVAISFLNSIVVPVTGGLKTVTDGFKAFFTGQAAQTAGGSAFAKQLEGLRPTFEGIRSNITSLIPIFQNFGKILLAAGQVFLQIASNPFVGYLARVYLNVVALTTVVNILNLRALIPFIANLARSAYSVVAFGVQCTLAGQKAVFFDLMVRTLGTTLRTFFAATAVGIILVGIGLIAEAFVTAGARADAARQKMSQFADSVKQLGAVGDVAGATAEKVGQQSLGARLQSAKALLQQVKSEGRKLTKGQVQELKNLQLTGNLDFVEVRRGPEKGMLAPQAKLTNLLGTQAALQAEIDSAGRGYLETQTKIVQATRAVTEAQSVQKKQGEESKAAGATAIDLSAGDGTKAADKAADKAAQDAERLANQKQQLLMEEAALKNGIDQASFEGLMSSSGQLFDYQKQLIEERNKLELSGLNDIEARQRKFQQDLKAVELSRIEAVRRATDDLHKTELDFVSAQRTAAAAGTGAPAAPTLPPPARGPVSPRVGSSFQGFPVTSAPGESRAYRNGTHEGYDFATPIGTALSYAIGGVVKSINKVGSGNAGKTLEVVLDNGIIGMSMHLSEVLIEAGQRFTAGQLLAKTGDTGAGPAHLHQESAPHAYKSGQAGASLAYLNIGKGKAMSGPSFSMEKREDKAERSVAVEAQNLENKATQLRITLEGELQLALERRASILAANTDSIFPVAQQQLENKLMGMRNQLMLQGMPEEFIGYQEDLAKRSYESAEATKKLEEGIKNYKTEIASLQDKQKAGIALSPVEISNLKLYQEGIKQNTQELARLTEQQKAYNIAALESAIASIKNADALKAQQDAIQLIDSNVESATGSYKNFIKEVAQGGDPKEALKKFQESITDQVLTVFLDYSFKPVEEFFKNSLKNMFGLPDAEKAKQDQLAKMEAQLAEQKKIAVATDQTAKNTAPGAGGSAGPVAGEAFSPGTALPSIAPGFDAGSVFGSPEALSGAFAGVQASISESMNGIVSSFENGASSLGNALPAWDTALSTNIPDALKTATNDTNKATPTFQESLGKVTAGIGIAAGAIMGIAAGIGQIKEGGTSNVLGGIGSVLMSLGGAVGGFAGFLKGANGGVAGGGWKPFPVTAFANGGMVNGPTLGLVGEGKYNEAIVPLPDGRSIPVQMKGGGGGLREAMSGSNGRASGSPILNMSFQSTNINGVEYVSRDQLEQAMAATRRQAASDGAKRGMSMTLDKLQQSPSTRSRLGMGGR